MTDIRCARCGFALPDLGDGGYGLCDCLDWPTDYQICMLLFDLFRVYYREVRDNFGRPCMLIPEQFKLMYNSEGKPNAPPCGNVRCK